MSNDMQLALERLQRENDRLRSQLSALQSRLAACLAEREQHSPTRYLTLTDRGDSAEGVHAVYTDTWAAPELPARLTGAADAADDYYAVWGHGDDD